MQTTAIPIIILNVLVLWQNVKHFHAQFDILPPPFRAKLSIKSTIDQWMGMYATSPATVLATGMFVINIVYLMVF